MSPDGNVVAEWLGPMTVHESGATILIAEDDQPLRELYEAWLPADDTVRSAANGQEALERLDDTVDIILLDRQMPQLSGAELLEVVDDREYDCQSAMITGVEPGFDILELKCEAYLTKPVSKPEVRTTVDRLHQLDAYSEPLQEYFALVSKKAVLEQHKRPTELAEHSRYDELVETVAAMRERLADESAAFDDGYQELLAAVDTEATALPNHR